jgi:hypothetical protein
MRDGTFVEETPLRRDAADLKDLVRLEGTG